MVEDSLLLFCIGLFIIIAPVSLLHHDLELIFGDLFVIACFFYSSLHLRLVAGARWRGGRRQVDTQDFHEIC